MLGNGRMHALYFVPNHAGHRLVVRRTAVKHVLSWANQEAERHRAKYGAQSREYHYMLDYARDYERKLDSIEYQISVLPEELLDHYIDQELSQREYDI